MPSSGVSQSTARLPEVAIRAVLASADRATQRQLITDLAKEFHLSRDVLVVFNRLAAAPDGHRLALLFVERMPTPIPSGLLLLAAPLLQARDASPQLRVAVAGRLISTLPDRPESIGPIVRALTAGLGKTRTLERLLRLQSHVERSESLDRIVVDTDRSTRLRCPRCSARLSRAALIRHLWKEHNLVYESGGAREPGPIVERTVAEFGQNREPESLDRIYAVTERMYHSVEPKQIHQAILTRLGTATIDPTSLAMSAGNDSCGLCPTCFVDLPPSLPQAPESLALSDGRLVGEGYTVEATRRKIAFTYADGSVDRLPDPEDRSNAREYAAKVGSGIAIGALALASFLPGKPLLPTVGVALAAVGGYSGLLYRERRVPNPDARAIAAAWSDLAPGMGRSPLAIRFLARLCRTSLGVGDPESRSKPLWELVEHAAVLAEKGIPQTQLFAAARLLQAHDSARIGKEWNNQLLDVFDPYFRGEVSPIFAETAAEILLEDEILSERDAARLRLQLPAAAFHAGLNPSALAALAERGPNLGRLMAGNLEWLELLHELWRMRNTRPWENAIGPAQSAFDLAKNGRAKTLLAYPDTLLVAEWPELGEVLIGRRGVTVGEFTVADPDATVSVETSKKGTTILIFGPHRIAVGEAISDRTLRGLKAWLTFRAERLMPAAGRSAGAPVPDRARQILEPAFSKCPICSTRSFIRVGEVGQPI